MSPISDGAFFAYKFMDLFVSHFIHFSKIYQKTSMFFDTQNAPIMVAPTSWASSEHLYIIERLYK
jgi:hypothetical protein